MLWQIVGIVVVAWAASSYMEWPFIPTAAAVAVAVYLYNRHTAPTAAGGGRGILATLGEGIKWIFGSIEQAVVGLVTFLVLMLCFVNATGISPFWALKKVVDMGVPWNWGADADVPTLLFVGETAIAAGIAIFTARKSWKPAAILVGVASIILVIIWMLPPVVEASRPKPKTPAVALPGESQAAADAKKVMAEKGIVPTAIDTTTRVVIGQPDPKHGVVGGGVKRLWVWAFGPPAPKSATSSPTTRYAPAPVAPTPTPAPKPVLHPFASNGCYETDLGYEARWSPNKGSMRVYDPAGRSHVETFGKKSPISGFGAGHWKFCAEDPDPASGVLIWE